MHDTCPMALRSLARHAAHRSVYPDPVASAQRPECNATCYAAMMYLGGVLERRRYLHPRVTMQHTSAW